MTLNEAITMADDIRPNSFSTATKIAWINSLEGRIASAVMLMAPEEVQEYHYSAADLSVTLLVDPPYDDIYVLWLAAKIDAANGEYDRYQNSAEIYNEHYESFVNWFLSTYDPAQGELRDPTADPPYYITAYGLAVKQGFEGTLDEWLDSLVGPQGETGPQGPDGPSNITSATQTTLTGVLAGDGSVVGVKAVDASPASGSSNLVTSGGVYTALAAKADAADVPTAYTSNPEPDGTASPGDSTAWARGNHIHPTDTSRMAASLKGAANGVAELDENGRVPTAQLPSYVDDVLEYSSTSAFPVTGESGKIYVALDTNLTYRWGGSAYVEISPSLALGETSGTAYRGDRGKTAYDFSQTPYASTPEMDGTGSAGASTAWARGDHIHPKDSTKADKTETAELMRMVLASYPTDTLSNQPVASFTDGADDIPVKSLVIGIEPVQSGSGDPAPDNVRPISGWTGANITASPTLDAQDGTTYSVSWQSAAGTVYGGTLNVTTGVLTVDRVLATLNGDMTWGAYAVSGVQKGFVVSAANAGVSDAKSGNAAATAPYMLCSLLPVGSAAWINGYCGMQNQNIWFAFDSEAFDGVAAFKVYANQNPIQIVVPIETPVTYQLTPTEIKTLLGANNIWADTGDTSVTYRADPTLYIGKKLAELGS